MRSLVIAAVISTILPLVLIVVYVIMWRKQHIRYYEHSLRVNEKLKTKNTYKYDVY